ncbi:hypothetical protein C3B44_00395 [Corynebacterium yudongzhengii]|uniref:DUF2183 domain-containing protein n=1 Tax=Corynebacterium yudongzhengii TaxID=2080740 RepID=A0A2U1T493_9CORY|nr:phosphatase domain-containing protein [Corynebacterium yudongzhengii]AWB82890.1 hypothetical protein C3B44_00395 [Corynebacterium yudongzhengii]PWC00785.1 DUF2183 domain-containing protein [Corynebacterium yudongzhengii]
MGFSDIVRYAENTINRFGVRRSTKKGWRPHLFPYRGYGTDNRVHVIGRVLMQDPNMEGPRSRDKSGRVEKATYEAKRGYRQFFTIQVADYPAEVRLPNGTAHTTYTNDNGYFDLSIEDHGLKPGWHEVKVASEDGGLVHAQVLITSSEQTVGIVSDIDDTIMVTNLPRALHAAYNSWVKKTDARQPVEGMREFYETILREHPHAPVFYLSTGAWNTYDTLIRFIHQHQLPEGPLLLTDWGPTPTGLFRSGTEHKKVQLRNLIIDYPNINWILVGDNGQHDPLTYGNLVAEHPEAVAGVAIRELTPSEHVLAHGTAVSLTAPARTSDQGVPSISAPDGFGLKEKYEANPFV